MAGRESDRLHRRQDWRPRARALLRITARERDRESEQHDRLVTSAAMPNKSHPHRLATGRGNRSCLLRLTEVQGAEMILVRSTSEEIYLEQRALYITS